MLDRRSQELLRIINIECNEGSYKVLEIDDLIRQMPKKFKVDFDTINQLVNYLKIGEYISLKYSDKEVICISPLPRGRRVFEIENEDKKNKKKNSIKKFFLMFFYLILIFAVCFAANYLSTYI